jgi:hypothetical protein
MKCAKLAIALETYKTKPFGVFHLGFLTRGSMTPISNCFSRVCSDSTVNLPELEMEVSWKMQVYP